MSDEEIRSYADQLVWENRRIWRTNVVLVLIAVVCVCLASYFFTVWWTNRQALVSAHQFIDAQSAQLAIDRRTADATLDALKKEQEAAGHYESQRDANWSALATSDKHLELIESWFNSYRAAHGDSRINWGAYFRGLER